MAVIHRTSAQVDGLSRVRREVMERNEKHIASPCTGCAKSDVCQYVKDAVDILAEFDARLRSKIFTARVECPKKLMQGVAYGEDNVKSGEDRGGDVREVLQIQGDDVGCGEPGDISLFGMSSTPGSDSREESVGGDDK